MQSIFAISGSTRKNSSNWKILKFIQENFKNQLNIEIYENLDQLPHFDPNLKEGEAFPPNVKSFFEKIQNADGVLICTPEYVFSPPAILKTALEWTVSETILSFKPLALIVASGMGEKTYDSLGLILKTLLQEEIPETSKLLIQGARGKFRGDGNFLDPETAKEVLDLMKSLMNKIGENDQNPN